jgi:predicted DNA-binding protein with PD1-like motif
MEACNLSSGVVKRVLFMKFEPGNDLLGCIEEAVVEQGIETGFVVSGIGSLKNARLRNVKELPMSYPITDKNRKFTLVDGPLEILSLEGNIVKREDGKLTVHAHIILSKVDGSLPLVMGGHLVEGNETYVMVEVV